MVKILLLEADRLLAKNAKDYLELSGHEVAAHCDPQAAVTAADKSRPDLIITDVMLAGRSGIEFLYELRSYPDWRDIPAIATGRLLPSEVESYGPAFEHLNVAEYLAKQTTPLARLAETAGNLLRAAA